MYRGDDLFEYFPQAEPVAPWKPRALTIEQWRSTATPERPLGGPDYTAVYAWRIERLRAIRASPINKATGRPVLLDGALEYYRTRPAEFIMDWMDTYDPRKAVKWMPFIFFQRQAEFIQFLNECYTDQQGGLVEKCRDMGLTWLCVAWSVWAWLFIPNVAIGWGSREEKLVDRLGEPDSIFEKIRLIIRRLPQEFLPVGFDPNGKGSMPYMKLFNPQHKGTISGEIGDNIGRGGRKTIYFKDESAHYEHADLIEASLGDNTNVQIDISSVNGLNNVFHRRRMAGVDWFPGCEPEPNMTRVFVADWRDHPEKTQAWFDGRKKKAENDGLLAKFAQEVERNYSASIEGVIIPLEWIIAAEDAHITLGHWTNEDGSPVDWTAGAWGAALDVADSVEGDRNALVLRKGIILADADEWGERDVGKTTRKAIDKLRSYKGIECQYDSVGMGSAVKSEYNRLTIDEKIIEPDLLLMVAWNAGAPVKDPYFNIVPDDDSTPLNRDFFGNLKAQAWWALKMRFYRVWQAVTQGIRHDPDSLIILDKSALGSRLRQIEQELAQPVMIQNTALKQIVDKKPDGAKSPNIADAIVMAYYPVDANLGHAIVGT